mgnify:CR=1 FL=1
MVSSLSESCFSVNAILTALPPFLFPCVLESRFPDFLLPITFVVLSLSFFGFLLFFVAFVGSDDLDGPGGPGGLAEVQL